MKLLSNSMWRRAVWYTRMEGLDKPAVSMSYGETDSVQSQKKLRGLSPHANYTDRAAAAGRRS